VETDLVLPFGSSYQLGRHTVSHGRRLHKIATAIYSRRAMRFEWRVNFKGHYGISAEAGYGISE
jgi:hypothetical protein